MITPENYKEVINSLSNKDKKRLKNTDKEFCVLSLHVFNVGSYATMRLTNDYNRYKNVSDNGNVILYAENVAADLN